jgi:hypothetical protein
VKVDDGAVQAKSVMGRSPLIANGGQGGRGGCRGARTAGEEERKGRKEMGVAHGGAAISFRRVEVGDDRRGGATRQARLRERERERERERGSCWTDRRRAGGSSPRPAGTSDVARPCRVGGSIGEREGLTGGPECTVPCSCTG